MSLKQLKAKLGIDDKLTKPFRGEKTYNKVADNVPLKPDFNFQADLLFLPAFNGFRYLLVVVDLGTNELDFEPIRNKNADTVLRAIKKIFDRPYLNKPKYSIRTDSGTEFKGVFKNFFDDNDILKKTALPGRHTQMANVESANKILGDIIMNYLNIDLQRRKKTGNWIRILPMLREELNEIRKPPKRSKDPYPILQHKKAKFKVGDKVHRMLDEPRNILGEKLGGRFRMGDQRYETRAREIEDIFLFENSNPYRYKLKGLEGVSFSEWQLIKA
jgi:hypothetical protein